MNYATVNVVETARQIENFLNNLPNTLGKGREGGIWTDAIKRGIGGIALENRYFACASAFPTPKDKEWLYDLVWFRNTPDHYLEDVVLVLESEWSRDPDDIYYDFGKLLMANAPIKVMIFQDHNNNLDDLWRMLERGIRSYRSQNVGEIYILAAFLEEQHKFIIKKGNTAEIYENGLGP